MKFQLRNASYTYNCPNRAGAQSCSGGGIEIASADGSNKCYFQWGDTAVGVRFKKNSEYGGGTVDATCSAGTGWSFAYDCPNKSGLKSCSAGGVPDYPSKSKGTPCSFGWPLTNAGQSVSLTSSTGSGTATARCDMNGQWQDLVVNCK